MRYEEVRNSIKTGDLIAFSRGGTWAKPSNFISNLIRVATKSQYTHVAVAYVVGGRVFVIEAEPPLVRIYPLSKLLPFYWIKTPFETTPQTEIKMLESVDVPYSRMEAIKAAFTKETTDSDSVQCAKLTNEVYSEFDPGFLEIFDTPGEVVEYTLRKHNCFVIPVD